MLGKAFNGKFKKNWVIEPFVWLAVLLLLTLSNISVDVLLAFEISSALTFGMFLLTWVNRGLLLPRFLLHRKLALYMLLSLILIAGAIMFFSELETYLVDTYMADHAEPEAWSPLDCTLPSAESKPFFDETPPKSTVAGTVQFKISILFLGSFFVSTLFHYFQKERADEQMRMALLQEKTEMELKFLKSQINPHFLFNALNNIYSMVYMGDKNAADSVLALSEMLRYVTDESGSDKINLADEITYLDNYLDFQKIRYEKDFNVTFEKNIQAEPIFISPMLFQPFIENAFKHSGVGSGQGSYVNIRLEANRERVRFSVVNSKRKKKQETQPSRMGVGMVNVQKRLDLLYPDRYELKVEDEETKFTVDLNIQLQ
ncbi:MAG: histidine kinase [Paludibacteraceae bacterium]|nr:histidine kinase [Paludibacteraceae bacterium]MBR4839965.1 histidine kinase [Paludibacteraceae bacterium]